jgi:hypothetical protein
MFESLARINAMPHDVLIMSTRSLVTDIRRTLIDHELALHERLAEIEELVDAFAPPPGPEPSPARHAGETGPGRETASQYDRDTLAPGAGQHESPGRGACRGIRCELMLAAGERPQ